MRTWLKWVISYVAVILVGSFVYLILPDRFAISPRLIAIGIGLAGFAVAKAWIDGESELHDS